MTIEKLKIRNFKLLKNIDISFSVEQNKPLTLVRAENGSGKTSILYAMIWAFYGESGLPNIAKELRLGSNSSKVDESIKISVSVVFTNQQGLSESRKYRLTRTVEEQSDADKIVRRNELFIVTEYSSDGEKVVVDPQGFIEKIIPSRLRDVFFTNGDDVQRFISGQVSQRERQSLVHESIKSLLGLDNLRKASADFHRTLRQIEKEISKVSGQELVDLEEQCEREESKLDALINDFDQEEKSIEEIEGHLQIWKKELKKHSGEQNLDEINKQISEAESDMKNLINDKIRIVSDMADHIYGPELSWSLCRPLLDSGYARLLELADNQVIPGVSLGILQDRLDIGICICGEKLYPESKHRHNVEELILKQKETSEKANKLTQTFHIARHVLQKYGAEDNVDSLLNCRIDLKSQYIGTIDNIRGKVSTIERLEEKRRGIDPVKIGQIEARISNIESKLSTARESLGSIREKKVQQEELVGTIKKNLEIELKTASGAIRQKDTHQVTNDLTKIIEGSLKILESEYLEKVSERMNDLFLYIVGSDINYEGSVFSGVKIDSDYNIIINTKDGKTLDPDFELNGASQRALTVSFIWALMEISGTIAPRIIDTPLGMIAGGVKERLTRAITKKSDKIEFQVILLLTRSEIRDIEDIFDESMGKWQTISCSSHFPEDLINNWGVLEPESRVCGCSHRESCVVCARHYDSKSGLVYRGNNG